MTSRRGFLGFLAGAAVAGPGVVKQTAAATMADLQLNGIAGTLAFDGIGHVDGGGEHWAARELAKLVGRSAAQHAFHKRRMSVHALDPDLVGYRSFSLAAKINIQRERNYANSLEDNRDYLGARIAGWFD